LAAVRAGALVVSASASALEPALAWESVSVSALASALASALVSALESGEILRQ
jgi:hypothetical protein